jgi:hypothetical protein
VVKQGSTVCLCSCVCVCVCVRVCVCLLHSYSAATSTVQWTVCVLCVCCVCGRGCTVWVWRGLCVSVCLCAYLNCTKRRPNVETPSLLYTSFSFCPLPIVGTSANISGNISGPRMNGRSHLVWLQHGSSSLVSFSFFLHQQWVQSPMNESIHWWLSRVTDERVQSPMNESSHW